MEIDTRYPPKAAMGLVFRYLRYWRSGFWVEYILQQKTVPGRPERSSIIVFYTIN